MQRKRIAIFATLLASLLLICLLTGVGSRSVKAATPHQETATEPEQQVLTQPVRLSLQQRIPVTLNMVSSQVVTTSESPTRPINQLVTQTIVLILNLDTTFDVTSTEPAVVFSPITFDFGAIPTGTLPAALFWDILGIGTANVTAELLAPVVPPTSSDLLTTTELLTDSVPVTESVPASSETIATDLINARTTVTGNVRDNASLESQIIAQLAPETGLQVVAQSEDQNWLLLASGYWVSVLVVEAVPVDLPTASNEQVTTLRTAGLAITGTISLSPTVETPVEPPPVESTPVETGTVTITESLPTTTALPAATPTTAPIEPSSPTSITITTPAVVNLRSGPGTEYGLLGSTAPGQQFFAVGRNQDASWLRLDNTAWIFAQLVEASASTDSLPELNPDGTPVLPPTPVLPTPTLSLQTTNTVTSTQTTLPTPTPGSNISSTLPTATPRPAIATPTRTITATATPQATTVNTTTQTISTRSTPTQTAASTVAISQAEQEYVTVADQIAKDYGVILTTIEELVSQANEDNAQLSDARWITNMRTQIAGLRQQGDRAKRQTPPERFVVAHTELLTATASFDSAATILTAAVQNTNITQFELAYVQFNLGEDSLSQLQKELAKLSSR